VDDDVIVNVKALAEYLRERRSRGNLYMVRQCPKEHQSRLKDINWLYRWPVQPPQGSVPMDCCNIHLQGCMKSGAVLTDKKYKWYEPDAWRFGDGAVRVSCPASS
jgi:hypothetical protein